MKLLPIWDERLKNIDPQISRRDLSYILKKSVQYYSNDIKFVQTQTDAKEMLAFLKQRPISHIGFDTEFKYDNPGTVIDKRNTAYDPRSIHPLLLSLAIAEPDNEGHGCLYRFVVDLRNPEVGQYLNEIFRFPVCFCGHYSKVEIFCLWQMGLTAPDILWDTFIFEKALHLGRNHQKYKLSRTSDAIEEIRIKKETQTEKIFSNSLVTTCQRYGVAYAMESDKERLQKSFMCHGDSAPFSTEQINYAAEDAIATAKLYPLQLSRAAQEGLLQHCIVIEMPWVITNARIEWNGVRIDTRKRDEILSIILSHKDNLESRIESTFGISNIRSHKQLKEFFFCNDILHIFKKNKKVSFDKKNLKMNQNLHPVIPLILAVRRLSDLKADKIMQPDFIGKDGRMHADHRQLGTDTGRQTCRWPNFLGLDRMLRPLVIPEAGYGIGEVDWSQVEVGIAAAVYNDEELIKMFNSGDVYSAMAQHFFCNELNQDDLSISGHEFKEKHSEFRNQMKSCTLGIIYGITPTGLAQTLGTTKDRAKALQNKFMEMFPQLKQALTNSAQYSAIRGYAQTFSGLRRNRGKQGKVSRWEKNWLTNHPVQGSASVIFKMAGNRLEKLYRQHKARIIIPLHDSFIFEAPLELLKTVAKITAQVMCNTLQENFPALIPQVEVNIIKPDCWNKDGDDKKLERWIEDLNVLMKAKENIEQKE